MTTHGQATDVLRQLAGICGSRFARFAGPADEVAGATARWVAVPGTVTAVTAVLRVAADNNLSVVARGAGSKLDWGAASPGVDVMLDTGRLAGVWHQPAGGLVAEVGAGTPIRAVQAVLERAGQRLPLDPPSADATVGGVVAADEAGPLRHRHGTPCDQLTGVSYLDAAGVLTHAGGWGDGGPTGRDLSRLLCGSMGALGVLVSATLRVRPIPASRLWVSRSVWTPLEMHDLVREILAAALNPAAIEVDLPAGRPALVRGRRVRVGPPGAGVLAVLLEGGRADICERAERMVALLAGDAQPVGAAPPWWGRYPFGPGDVAMRIEVPITDLHAAVYALRDAAGGPVPVRGSAGVGVVHAALPGAVPPERVAAILAGVRGVLGARGGACVVVAAPPTVRRSVDLWGELPALALMRSVKKRLDPQRRLAPGRLPGGI